MTACFALLVVAVAGQLPQPVVLGPFPLGDLILAQPKDNWLVKDFTAAGLDLEDVRKQMNGWKMFVVDYKIRGKDGAWCWYRPAGGKWPPQAMVTGRLSIEVKDKRGVKVEIALAECDLHGASTNSGDGKGGVPFVTCHRHVTLRFHNLAVPVAAGPFAGATEYPKQGGQSLSRIRYDINGIITIEKR